MKDITRKITVSRTASRSLRDGLMPILLFVLAAALIIRNSILIYDLARPMPNWDHWEFMRSLPVVISGQYGLSEVFAHHNEHRIATARLFFLADAWWFDASNCFLIACSVMLCAVIGAVLAWRVSADLRWRACLVLVSISLLLCLAQADNFASGFQVQFPLVDLLAVLAIAAVALPMEGGRHVGWLLGALAADFLSVFSMASGIVLIVPLLWVGVLVRRPVWGLATLLAFHVVVAGIHIHGLLPPVVPPSYDPIKVILFTVAYLGNVLRGYDLAPFLLGAVTLAAFLGLAARLTLQRVRTVSTDRALVFLAGVAAFVVCGGVVTATGRIAYGPGAPLTSRYAMQGIMFTVAVGLLAWRQAALRWPSGWSRNGIALALLAVSAAGSLAPRPLEEWRDHVADFDTAGSALSNGVLSDSAISIIYPDPASIRSTVAFMAARRLGPFSPRYAAIYRPPVNALVGVDIASLPPCQAANSSARATGPTWREFDGWIVDPRQPAENGWVLAFDQARRLVGFTRQSTARTDVATALRDPGTRYGYRIALNLPVSDLDAGRTTLVLVPNDGGALCRAIAASASAGPSLSRLASF